MGDITELAASIFRFGLLHPIVVDVDGNLVAGARRLKACQSIGWTEIEALSLGELTSDELRLIELEENLKRKDLTSLERSNPINPAQLPGRHFLRQQVLWGIREVIEHVLYWNRDSIDDLVAQYAEET